MTRVCIIGLDCLTPQLTFDSFAPHLPTFTRLRSQGQSGVLRSIDPPITVPAWACMMTGLPPGELGIYGFRDRKYHDYDSHRIASSLSVRAPTLWDRASQAGLYSCVIGVPLTYPAKPLRGKMLTGPMTADKESGAASYPPELLDEVESDFGRFHFDIQGFRHRSKSELLRELYQLSEQRFDLTEHWLDHEPWDLMVMVDIAPDRLHHIFWGDMVDSSTPTDSTIFAFYQHLDRRLARIEQRMKPDDILLIVSDHGAQTMEGGVALNQWLIDHHYLKLKESVEPGTKLAPELVDWRCSKVWAAGGYAGRFYLNIIGREPQGIVRPEDVPSLKSELYDGLRRLKTLSGAPMPVEIIEPSARWKDPKGLPPDLLIYLDSLKYRALGTVGWKHHLHKDNDIGRDGANHQHEGIWIARGSNPTAEAQLPLRSLVDVYPAVSRWLQLDAGGSQSL